MNVNSGALKFDDDMMIGADSLHLCVRIYYKGCAAQRQDRHPTRPYELTSNIHYSGFQ
jgi:hypothetical protein